MTHRSAKAGAIVAAESTRTAAGSVFARKPGADRRRRAAGVTAAALALPFAPGACGSDSASDTGGKQHPASTMPSGSSSPATASSAATEADFNQTNFDHSTVVRNEWLPLSPGTQLTLEGSAKEDGKPVRHTTVTTVTNLTKTVNRVRNIVVWERDYTDGELVEAELAFFAQDKDGNVWHFGQYPEVYEGGTFVKAPAWLAGLQGAKAGIPMRARPRTGTSSYAEGWVRR
jgi:hypothetical protein